ncbi:MAG: 50S ribosomal protein L1 [Candidatus Sumerlaeia bacterium]|nr:50S ribosomal protein L1 [Candidatus Sumerlaeia bacterium]
MARHGKKYSDRVKLVDRDKRYTVAEAVGLLRQVAFAKFDESVQLNIRLGVDPRNADQQVRGTVALPHGTGKKVRVAVFAAGDKLREAEEAGADVAGGEDLVKRVQEGFLDFDAAVATPDMMRFVGKLGKVLGPRGMMPNPKVGTVTMDVRGAIEALKGGQVEYRLDRFAIVHVLVGKMSFNDQQLTENVEAMLEALMKAKPSAAKGTYMRSITLSSTMSPGIRIDSNEARVKAAAV